VVPFSGRVTFFATLLDEHRSVVGRLVTDGLTENVQPVAFLTDAPSMTQPPNGVNDVGVTMNERTEGLGVPAAPANEGTMKATSAATAVRGRRTFHMPDLPGRFVTERAPPEPATGTDTRADDFETLVSGMGGCCSCLVVLLWLGEHRGLDNADSGDSHDRHGRGDTLVGVVGT
jgi:hypothetical protein